MKIIFTCLIVIMLCASNSEAELTMSDYFSLVEQFKTTKDQDANIIQLTESLKINESDVDMHIKRGREYILKAVQLEAGTCLIRDLNKPDEMVCPDPLVSSKVFFKNEISGFYANALQDLEKALRIDSKAYSAFYTKAIYFNLIGDFEKSVENINKYIELRPNKEAGYFLRAFYYKNQKSVPYMDSAIKDFTKVISMNPKSEGAYFYRSQAYQNKLWLLYPSGVPKADKSANKLVSLVLADLNSAIKIKKETDFYSSCRIVMIYRYTHGVSELVTRGNTWRREIKTGLVTGVYVRLRVKLDMLELMHC
jgi:tetratricopeptide (TPR) repeat protein